MNVNGNLQYKQAQRELFDELENKFKNGEKPSTIVEPVKDYENDNRICLTSVAFIPPHLQEIILSTVVDPLKSADSQQYYYIQNSFHLTIQNIRTINLPLLFNDSDIEKAIKVFDQIVPKHKHLFFDIEGLFELPTSLSLRAYADKGLKDLALELRRGLKEAGVPDNKTYASSDVVFGNTSVCRYTTTPNDLFFNEVKRLKNIKIGRLEVSTVSLITTNSVCHPSKTKIIKEFNLA